MEKKSIKLMDSKYRWGYNFNERETMSNSFILSSLFTNFLNLCANPKLTVIQDRRAYLRCLIFVDLKDRRESKASYFVELVCQSLYYSICQRSNLGSISLLISNSDKKINK